MANNERSTDTASSQSAKEQEFNRLIQKLNYDLGAQSFFALEGNEMLLPITPHMIRQTHILAKFIDDEYAVARAFAKFFVELFELADQNILDTADRVWPPAAA